MKYILIASLCLSSYLLPAQSLGLRQLGVLGGELSTTDSPVLVHSMGAIAATIVANDQTQLDQGMFLACDLPCTNIKTGIGHSIYDNSTLSVYPNPSKDYLFLKGEQIDRFRYQLFHVTGQLVKEGTVNQGKISLIELPTGVYLLRAYDTKGHLKLVNKVIKQ